VGHVISTEWTSVLTVIVTGQCQTLITATILLVQITVMAPPATNTKRLSEVLVHVPMGLNHTKATVILLTVLIMHMLVLVTSTRSMLAVQVHALELDQTDIVIIIMTTTMPRTVSTVDYYHDKCKKLNSLKHLVRTTVAGSHN